MPNFVCVTCGTQFAATDAPPDQCPICEDERQYVPSGAHEAVQRSANRYVRALMGDVDAPARVTAPR